MRCIARIITYALVLPMALSVGPAACVSTGTLGLVAKSGADPGRILREAHTYQELGHAEGQGCRFFVIDLIPFGDSTLSTALDHALEKKGGNALVNVSTSTSLYGFVPIWNILSFTCTTIQGTAIKIDGFEP